MSSECTLEQFLAPLSAALGRTEPRDEAGACAALDRMPRRVHTDDPAELEALFCAAAEAMHVTVHRCSGERVGAEIAAIVSAAVGARDAAEAASAPGAILPADARVAQLGLDAALQSVGIPFATWNPDASAAENREACLKAAVGITFAEGGVAETGSVVQFCNANCGRSISLLPDTHVAIVDAATIRAQMSDALRELSAHGDAGTDLPSQVCFISGPSNTSDIELVRVEGVHGPVYVHYIVIEAV